MAVVSGDAPADAGFAPAAAASLPERARVVVIGGGVAGASIAYHLAAAGETDVLVLDRAELTSGSTFHSAGMVGQLRSDPTLTRMNTYSVQLYRELQAGEHPVSWVESGSLRLASSPERMVELTRQLSWARYHGLPMERVTAAEAQQLFPPLDTAGVVGGVFMPTDGYLDPAQLCQALASAARSAGVQVAQQTRVLGIDVTDHRVRAVRTDRGDVECELVVNAGGIYAAEIGRLAGVRIPLVPLSHQYLVTEEITRMPSGLPSLRDPDLLVYFRPEGRGLLVGGYERAAATFAVNDAGTDRVPGDFNGRLLTEDWPRLTEIAANAARRVPVFESAGIRTVINGPEAFTPDNEFCLGETEVDGLFVAAGFCAHGIAGAGGVGRLIADWMLGGEPLTDVRHMDIARFGPAYRSGRYTVDRTIENYQSYYDIPYPERERTKGRPLLVSPVYDWHRDHGAVFGEKAGWERVLHYAANNPAAADPAAAVPAPRGWAGRSFAAAAVVEHRACRQRAALFDESSFAKLAVTGPDAAAFLQYCCDNDVARDDGAVTYTQLLNRSGGIESDLTVTRLGRDEFRLVIGTASGSADALRLGRLARVRAARVRIADISRDLACFALWGPLAAEVLQPLTDQDVSSAAFAFMTARRLTVAGVPVLAQRVTYVGEFGWELYVPAADGAAVWAAVWQGGRSHGLVAGGYRAIETLRLEQGYRAWGTDITSETSPLEAGLGFCVAWDKPGGFLGLEALRAQREAGVSRRLCCLTLDDPAAVVVGGEPVSAGGEVVGRVTSGGFGYSVGESIAYAYLPVAHAPVGSAVEIELFGERIGARVRRPPLVVATPRPAVRPSGDDQ